MSTCGYISVLCNGFHPILLGWVDSYSIIEMERSSISCNAHTTTPLLNIYHLQRLKENKCFIHLDCVLLVVKVNATLGSRALLGELSPSNPPKNIKIITIVGILLGQKATKQLF